MGQTVVRQVARTHRPFKATIFDTAGHILCRIDRPFYWISSNLTVQTVGGKSMGEIYRNWHLWWVHRKRPNQIISHVLPKSSKSRMMPTHACLLMHAHDFGNESPVLEISSVRDHDGVLKFFFPDPVVSLNLHPTSPLSAGGGSMSFTAATRLSLHGSMPHCCHGNLLWRMRRAEYSPLWTKTLRGSGPLFRQSSPMLTRDAPILPINAPSSP